MNKDIIEKSRWWKAFRALEEEKELDVTGDQVILEELVHLKEEETVTEGGIIIPQVQQYRETVKDHITPLALVLAVGPGQQLEDGSVLPPTVKVGDVVVCPTTTEWYTVYFGVDCVKNRIGRIRSAQIPNRTSNYSRVKEILRTV